MQTIAVGLFAGFLVGIVCVIYVFLRTYRLVSGQVSTGKGHGPSQSMPYSESLTSSGLMFMAIFGSGSMLWGFIGAGIYHLIRDDLYFFILSISLAVFINIWIWRSKTTFAVDKMVLSVIIFIGLGVLIPWLI